MALSVRKVRDVRVAFLTDTSFALANSRSAGALKKRALLAVQKKCRVRVVEDSSNPDIIFTIYRLPGSKSWCLRLRAERS